MFVHPQCPCTRASIAQLAEILSKSPAPIATRLYFYSPDGQPASWVEAENWALAAAIPGVQRVHDRDGEWATRFRAGASGHTVVYRGDGALAFSGGITASRGHLGTSLGGEAILRIARGESPDVMTAPAFGCSILGADNNTP